MIFGKDRSKLRGLTHHLSSAMMPAVVKAALRSSSSVSLSQLSLDKDAPVSRAIEVAGRIFGRPVLGGLHHQYLRTLICDRHRD